MQTLQSLQGTSGDAKDAGKVRGGCRRVSFEGLFRGSWKTPLWRKYANSTKSAGHIGVCEGCVEGVWRVQEGVV